MVEQTAMPWAPEPEDDEETITGKVVRIIHEGDGGFRVVRVAVEGSGEEVWVGAMPALREGMAVTGTGRYEPDPRRKGEDRFATSLVMPVMPKTVAGLYEYFASGTIPGIGPSLARRIVDKFGELTVEILDKEPARLLEVDGIGDKTLLKIQGAWSEKRAIAEIMMFLVGHGATAGLAFKIYERYGNNAIGVILENPFRLARDVHGVGFATADKIARECGVALDSPERDQAGVLEVLFGAENKGHTFMVRHKLAHEAGKLLDRAESDTDRAIQALAEHGDVALDATALGAAVVMRAATYRLESSAARKIAALLTAYARPPRPRPDGTTVAMADAAEEAIVAFEAKTGFTLAPEQREAVRLASKSKIMVLTGGPGCGKTAVTRALLGLYRIVDLRVALCAPTGRAAKRMSEATGAPAKTIHRTLGFDPSDRGFLHREERPLDEDVIVVDETSMLSLDLCASLTAAIKLEARVVFVGDIDQLPSVGAGAVLRDLIAASVIPTVRLTHIFRQAAGSAIVDNAHRVNRGETPVTSPSADGEFHWIEPHDEAHAAWLALRAVTTRIPERWGLDAKTEIQVLVPMHKGATGTFDMNRALQAALNPPGPPQVVREGIAYRVGDRVMQTSNDAQRDVFNGDQGFITAIGEDDAGKPTMTIAFDGREVIYIEKQFRQVRLAYAITTHRFQGSEAPAVVVVMLSKHYVMLSRPWLYTSLTRGKQRVVLIAEERAVRVAVTSTRKDERLTMLAPRIHALTTGSTDLRSAAVLDTERLLRGPR